MEQADMHLGRPVVRAGLTLFPVFNGRAVATRGYDVHSPSVDVRERPDGPLVTELVMTNSGTRPALVLEGELLEGGWQHRVVARSAVVEPGVATVLEVRCVEQRRWQGGHRHERGGRCAPVSVRAAGDQGQVWERVGRYGTSSTGSLLETARGREEAAAALVRDLRPRAFQSGVLIGIGGQPVLVEVFDSPRTLAQVWGRLVHAAAIDAVGAPAVETPGRRARRFVQRVERRYPAYARVAVLGWRGRAIHTVAVNPRHELVTA
ncbi:ARPP-1 family domain-containing protein [Pseudonocardia hispaniensis]|uniref:ARPP-1 family domain-containing protein n=1 Tax=Pseudonocardia hispaniensis TaxID=904933 RepID=A0ABW1IZ71_9PSEU